MVSTIQTGMLGLAAILFFVGAIGIAIERPHCSPRVWYGFGILMAVMAIVTVRDMYVLSERDIATVPGLFIRGIKLGAIGFVVWALVDERGQALWTRD